jgi:hypothetical protein
MPLVSLEQRELLVSLGLLVLLGQQVEELERALALPQALLELPPLIHSLK